MTSETAVFVHETRRRFDDECSGRSNPLGLRADDPTLNDGVVGARSVPRLDHGDLESSLHGGIAASDE